MLRLLFGNWLGITLFVLCAVGSSYYFVQRDGPIGFLHAFLFMIPTMIVIIFVVAKFYKPGPKTLQEKRARLIAILTEMGKRKQALPTARDQERYQREIDEVQKEKDRLDRLIKKQEKEQGLTEEQRQKSNEEELSLGTTESESNPFSLDGK